MAEGESQKSTSVGLFTDTDDGWSRQCLPYRTPVARMAQKTKKIASSSIHRRAFGLWAESGLKALGGMEWSYSLDIAENTRRDV